MQGAGFLSDGDQVRVVAPAAAGTGRQGRARDEYFRLGDQRPLPALMIFFVLCVAGLYGFHKLPVARFPDVAFPMVTVAVSLPGASPRSSRPRSRARSRMRCHHQRRQARHLHGPRASSTAIEFVLETDLSEALDDVRDAVTRIRADLPQDIQEPVIGARSTSAAR